MSRTAGTRSFVLVSLAAVWVIAAAPALAQDYTGDYTLVYQGSEVLAIQVQPSRGGQIAGVVSSAGTTLPFTGSIRDGALVFTTTGEDGQSAVWEARFAGEGLAVTVNVPGEPPERLNFTRRGAGWSGGTALAREWAGRLTGRSFTLTERTDGGDSGGAVTETQLSFCSSGRAILEQTFTLSADVPGLQGSGTRRESEEGRWEVLTNGADVSLQLTSTSGEAFQLGIAAGSEPDILIVADRPVRLSSGQAC